MWRVTGGEPGYDGVHHHTRPQHLVNDARHGQILRAGEHLHRVIGSNGCSLTRECSFKYPHMLTPNRRAMRAQTLKKKYDHWREERVVRSRTKF